MKKSWRLWGGLLLVVVLLAALFYTRVYQPKSTYQTLQPTQGEFKVWVQGLGELGAQRFYPLGFTGNGRLTATQVDQGDKVAKGQLLAQLDAAELTATLGEMQALQSKTRLEVKASLQDIELNQERYDLAKLAHNRNKSLLKRKMISQAVFDQSESAMMQADIAVKSARTRLTLVKAELQRIEKSLEVIEVKLNNLKLYAPENLFVVERLAEAGESVVPGQAIFKVLEPQSLWVKAYIDERVSGKLALNQPAEIVLRSKSKQQYQGFVKRIDAQSDAVTLERVVYIGFQSDLPPPFLFEQAQVKIHTDTLPDVWILPNKVLSMHKEQQGVWLKQDGRAQFVPLTIAAANPQAFALAKQDNPQLNADSVLIVPDKSKKPLFKGARVFP